MIKYQIVKDCGGICRKDLSVREECSTLKVHEHFTHAVIHTFLIEKSSRIVWLLFSLSGERFWGDGRRTAGGQETPEGGCPRTPYRWSVIAPLWCLGLPVITTYYGRYHYCHRHHHTYHQEKVVYAAFYFPVSDHSSS